MQISESAVYRCDIDTLWQYITEPEKQKLWMKGVLSNESTSPGRTGVGSTFRMVIQEGRKQADYQGEVTAHEKPHRLEVRMWGGNFPAGMAIRVDYRLAEQTGGVRLDYCCTTEVEKAGFFLRLMLVLFKCFGRMQLRTFLSKLRKLVEHPDARAA